MPVMPQVATLFFIYVLRLGYLLLLSLGGINFDSYHEIIRTVSNLVACAF